MVEQRVPTFFIIGAPKAGTTSLHAYLSEHPEIAMTSIKEPSVFVRDDWVAKLSVYDSLFDSAAEVRGEASTAYSGFPWGAEVPERVAATVPDAKIIYLVRDPIDRSVAHYLQNCRDGVATRSFKELLRDPDDPLNAVIWSSRYATQLARWTAWFDRGQVLVIDDQSLRDDRLATMRTILGFLDVDPDFQAASWDREHNSSTDHRVLRVGRRAAALRMVESTGLMRRLLTRPIPPLVLTADQRSRLEALFTPEVAEFRRVTGMSFDSWSV